MEGSPIVGIGVEDYRGPTRQELGTLARSLMFGIEREDYSGPTRQELGSLARWVEEAESSPGVDIPAPHPEPPSLTAFVACPWDADWSQPWEHRDPDLGDLRSASTEPPGSDSILRELDEIEHSLRKRGFPAARVER